MILAAVLMSTIVGIIIGHIIGRHAGREPNLHIETLRTRTYEALNDYEELLDGEEWSWNKQAFNLLNDWVYYT